MKKILAAAAAFAVALECMPGKAPAASAQTAVYVSAGAENGDGSFDKPFGTLEEARNKVRAIKKDAKVPINVYLRGGLYSRSETFTLEEQDSGTAEAPVTWQSYRGETATIVGGTELSMADFVAADDAAIPEDARGKVYKCNIRKMGIADYGELAVRGNSQYSLHQLGLVGESVSDPEIVYHKADGEDFVGVLARYPNDGYMTVDNIEVYGDKPGRWGETEGSNEYVPPEQRHNPPIPPSFSSNDTRYQRWGNAKYAWVFGYWRYDWSDQTMRVDSIDKNTGVIKSATPSAYSILLGQRFYIYNLLEELDSVGEWYYDKDSGFLYVYPPEVSPEAKMTLSFAKSDIVSLNKLSYVNFKRINFTATRSNAVSVNSCSDVRMDYLEICNVAGMGVGVYDSYRTTVSGCHIYNTGASCVNLAGGDANTLTPSGNVMENCWLHDFAKTIKTYEGGVKVGGVGATVRNNLIYNGPHIAVRITGNDHLIENNEIHSVMKEAADMGAIYTGRRIAARGTVIRGNIIHDLKSDSKQSGKYAIYLDDMQCGYTIENNIFYNISGTGIFINGGSDNNVTGNIFANIDENSVLISAWGRCFNVSGFTEFNDEAKAYYGMTSVPYMSEAYAKYPHLQDIENDPWTPKYNRVENNVSYMVKGELKLALHPEWGSDATEGELREKNTLTEGVITSKDPGFGNAAENDYNLKSDSIVFSKLSGFAPIKMEDAGLTTAKLKELLSDDAVVVAEGKNMGYVGWKRTEVDENPEITPFYEEENLYIPLRFTAAAAGADLDYKDGFVYVDFMGNEYYLKNGERQATVRSGEREEKTELSAAVIIRGGRTFISAEDAAVILGKQAYKAENGVVVISGNDVREELTKSMLDDLFSRI